MLVSYVQIWAYQNTTRSRIKIKSKSLGICLHHKLLKSTLLSLFSQIVKGMLKRLEKRRSKQRSRMKSLSHNKRRSPQSDHWHLNKRYKGQSNHKTRLKFFGKHSRDTMVKCQANLIEIS